MVKPTQTIRQQIADELFECVSPFCEISAKRVKNTFLTFYQLYDDSFPIRLAQSIYQYD